MEHVELRDHEVCNTHVQCKREIGAEFGDGGVILGRGAGGRAS